MLCSVNKRSAISQWLASQLCACESHLLWCEVNPITTWHHNHISLISNHIFSPWWWNLHGTFKSKNLPELGSCFKFIDDWRQQYFRRLAWLESKLEGSRWGNYTDRASPDRYHSCPTLRTWISMQTRILQHRSYQPLPLLTTCWNELAWGEILRKTRIQIHQQAASWTPWGHRGIRLGFATLAICKSWKTHASAFCQIVNLQTHPKDITLNP